MVIGKYKTKKGYKFYVSIYLDGKRVFRRGFETKEEAMKKGLEITENKFSDKVPTFNDLLDHYMEDYKKRVKISTYYRILKITNKYMRNKIPNIKVSKLTYNHFNIWWSDFKKNDLDTDYKNFILRILILIFDFCDIFYNYRNYEVKKLVPIRDYSVKKIDKVDETDKYITYENFKKLISVIDSEFWRLFFFVAYFSGIRRNEILALQVTEVPMKEVFVYQQISLTPKKIYNHALISPKSKSSVGKILLPKFVMEMLNKHIEFYHLKVNNYIFFTINKNKAMSGTCVAENLKKYAKLAGLENAEKYHMHMFRHGEATLLDESGINDNVVSKVLRHSSAEITKRVYIHKTEKEIQEVQNLLDSFEKDFK